MEEHLQESPIRLTVEAESEGLRLDRYISTRCPDISRSYAQKLIDEGLVTVDGAPAKASFKLAQGAAVVITVPPPQASTLSPQDIPVRIVYEDDELLVVDKPAGLTVHPAPGHPDGTLANAILSHLPELGIGDRQRPGIVHRLDKDTSGLLVIAKTPRALEDLSNQFKTRTVSKVYLALVKGRITPKEAVIEAPIGRDRSHRERMSVVDSAHGREARTIYRVIEYLNDYSLLEVKPETGRTHQIRVHLAAVGYPVVGDAVYGVRSPLVGRQFLHAHRLRFRLPSSGEMVEFISGLPADLQKALETIRASTADA